MLRIWFRVLRNYFLKQENHIFLRKSLIWRWKNRKKIYSCFKKTNIILMLRIWFLVLRKYFLKQENHIFLRKWLIWRWKNRKKTYSCFQKTNIIQDMLRIFFSYFKKKYLANHIFPILRIVFLIKKISFSF
jgi:hypothetical protein